MRMTSALLAIAELGDSGTGPSACFKKAPGGSCNDWDVEESDFTRARFGQGGSGASRCIFCENDHPSPGWANATSWRGDGRSPRVKAGSSRPSAGLSIQGTMPIRLPHTKDPKGGHSSHRARKSPTRRSGLAPTIPRTGGRWASGQAPTYACCQSCRREDHLLELYGATG